MSYGDLLIEARTRRGLDLGTLSRRLRVRADILDAIEKEDFSRLPARGYAKNMVRAYARELGLDERRIGDMFAHDFTVYENGGAPRRSTQNSGEGEKARSHRVRQNASRDLLTDSPNTNRSQRSRDTGFSQGYPSGTRQAGGLRTRRSGTASVDVRAGGNRLSGVRARTSYTSRESRLQRAAQTSPSPKRRFAIPLPSFNFGRSKQAHTPGLGYVGAQQGPKGGLGSAKRAVNPVALIFAAVIVILIIAIAVVLFNSQTKKSEPVPDIPISGLTDTSNTTQDAQSASVATAPTSAKFEYSVADGGESWIEIYENGSDTPLSAGIVSGPKTETIDVTGTLEFKTANVTPVTLKVDGTQVEPVSDGTGYYTYTVNFPEILAEWQKANAAGSSSSSSAATTQ